MDSSESSKPEVVTVDAIQAKDLVGSSGGHRYLDVRTEADFNKAHPDAGDVLNIPYLLITPEGRVKNPHFLEQVSTVCSLDDKIVVGCRSGGRSLSATGDLLNAGYKNVCNMGGGYLAWVERGLPTKEQRLLTKNPSTSLTFSVPSLDPMDNPISSHFAR